MIQSNCTTYGSKKSRFIKEQQAMGILSNLGIKTPLSKVFTAGPSSSERISQGSGIFDSLIYNTRQNRMKDALWNAFNQ